MTDLDTKADIYRRKYTDKLNWNDLPDQVQEFWRERFRCSESFKRTVAAEQRIGAVEALA